MALFKDHKVRIQKILELIPEDLLFRLAKDTKVDYCAKVLFGERIFNLLLYGILTTERTSQRVLEDLFESDLFKTMFSYASDMKISRSSISTRLSVIDSDFFRLAYEQIYLEFSKYFSPSEQQKYKVIRVDSSMVAETCNKLTQGLSPGNARTNGGEKVKQVKLTMAFDGLTACNVKLFTDPQYTSEDIAIPELILNDASKTDSHLNIYTFDRGVAATKAFANFNTKDIRFVGRLKTNRRFHIVESEELSENQKDLDELYLLSSQVVNLSGKCAFDYDQCYRLIIAKRKIKKEEHLPGKKASKRKTEDVFYFITNDLELEPKEIAEIYKQRWEIEVFFRFIKQELNASHFISVSENGIKVVLYMTLIASMLLLLYKKQNGLGYKTAKRRFTIELWQTLVAVIVKECGGNPELMKKEYFSRFSVP
ncbi:IS4 family transposase [Alkalitalea saponilacus]|uniref:Transposase DDE domain-containing protein n=1 Tax=Alkalitalea saponilacus TaxID=889453 RepID=A0A1T5A635_9BACT|nr:IS4 family transposase [Alkalitalea saponilacus]ASB48833.1 transposase [Alkalitalea saponilacus]SKB30398.1 Transposase DDE domain-containing protein [Alkalitalea saponilacus]